MKAKKMTNMSCGLTCHGGQHFLMTKYVMMTNMLHHVAFECRHVLCFSTAYKREAKAEEWRQGDKGIVMDNVICPTFKDPTPPHT